MEKQKEHINKKSGITLTENCWAEKGSNVIDSSSNLLIAGVRTPPQRSAGDNQSECADTMQGPSPTEECAPQRAGAVRGGRGECPSLEVPRKRVDSHWRACPGEDWFPKNAWAEPCPPRGPGKRASSQAALPGCSCQALFMGPHGWWGSCSTPSQAPSPPWQPPAH